MRRDVARARAILEAGSRAWQLRRWPVPTRSCYAICAQVVPPLQYQRRLAFSCDRGPMYHVAERLSRAADSSLANESGQLLPVCAALAEPEALVLVQEEVAELT
jgi:hypothetical protein